MTDHVPDLTEEGRAALSKEEEAARVASQDRPTLLGAISPSMRPGLKVTADTDKPTSTRVIETRRATKNKGLQAPPRHQVELIGDPLTQRNDGVPLPTEPLPTSQVPSVDQMSSVRTQLKNVLNIICTNKILNTL